MHSGELAEIDLLRSTAARLRSAPHGGQGAIIKEAAVMLGVSAQTLYTKLRGVGWTSGRQRRSDRGDTRVSEAEIRVVAALLGHRRANGKRIMVVSDAIEIALANGQLSERISPATALRLMQVYHCHPSQLDRASPHTPMRTLYPNQLWQLDPSLCVLYYLPKSSGLSVMDERTYNARKPEALARTLKERVLRYVITDHYTGAIHLRYVMAPGETQQGLLDVLIEAMTQREGFVVHGVPEQLVWDCGSANQAHGVQNFLRALGVRQWPHMPGNPRAKGQVECANNIIERRFEARLAFMQVHDLEQLNAAADAWSRDFNSTQLHSRHGHSRWGLWSGRIRTEHLRLCPTRETCFSLVTSRPEPRKVTGELTISFKPRGHERADYNVAHVPNVHAGDELQVIVSAYAAPNVFVITHDAEGVERFVECTPSARDDVGFYVGAPVFGERFARQADTVVDDSRKEIAEQLWGSRERDAADQARKAGRVAMNGTLDPMADIKQRAADLPHHMQRRGTEIHLANAAHVELKPLDLVATLQELRARLGRSPLPAEREAVQAWFPDGVPPEEFDSLLARLQQLSTAGNSPPVFAEPPRLVAVK
jgi:transposase InsO family protein